MTKDEIELTEELIKTLNEKVNQDITGSLNTTLFELNEPLTYEKYLKMIEPHMKKYGGKYNRGFWEFPLTNFRYEFINTEDFM